MAKYSEDKFQFKSAFSPDEIVTRLRDRTLIKKTLLMVTTNKDFIGRVEENSFAIIGSSLWPYGATCVIKGMITPASQIVLTSTLHKAFRMLWLIWLVVMVVEFILMTEFRDTESLFAFLVGFPILAFIFRLFIHGMYVLTRNYLIEKMKTILGVVE